MGGVHTLFFENVTMACFSIGAPGERSRVRAIYDFVPFDGDPPERRGYVAIPPLGGSLKRSARAVQLFGRLAVLETHTLRY